MLLSTSNVTF